MKAVHRSKLPIARFFSNVDLPGDKLNKLSSTNALSNNSLKGDDDKSEKSYSLNFKKELDKTEFTIFRPIADCGYYGWNPMINMKLRPLPKIKSVHDILRHIRMKRKPKKILPLSQLKVPFSFKKTLPWGYYPNEFPFGGFIVASLYVASKYRNVDLNNVNFVFGGSVLEMLAQRDDSKPYVVCRIPTTKSNDTYLVRNCSTYQINLTTSGYQFERYATTGFMCRRAPLEFLEHMQVMDVGAKFKVLICAKADAIDDGADPIEITAQQQRNWGTKVMFQMISGGSPTVCYAKNKDDNKELVTDIAMQSLSTVAADALRNRNCQTLERNIIDGMQAIYDQMKGVNDNESYGISFAHMGGLSLHRVQTSNTVLLPPEEVVQQLLEEK